MHRVSILYALFTLLAGAAMAADPACPPPIVPPGARILYLVPVSAGYSDEPPVRARRVDATVNMAIADGEVGGGVVVVRFAGDAFYRESQDSRATFAFQGNAFVIWGGNATKPVVGQTVNFWGDQWVAQVTGGEWDSNASF